MLKLNQGKNITAIDFSHFSKKILNKKKSILIRLY